MARWRHEIRLNTGLQSQIYVDRGACNAVYTGSIPVVAFKKRRISGVSP
jgi:hypothetical protein